ncbi:MAG: ABC transporter ATP-binding protein [Oscillospiraceae bacterium]|nr:ABC transporter ATP-binding protein [Oscillospiraceae bacterium]
MAEKTKKQLLDEKKSLEKGNFQKPKDAKKTIKRLLGYMTHKKWPIVLVLSCLILSTLSSLAGTYIMRPMINTLAGDAGAAEKLHSLGISLLVLLGVFLVGVICNYVQGAMMAVLAQRAVNKLRSDLFDALERLPLSYFDRHPHGELMSRFTNDADNVYFAMEQSMINLISSVLSFVGIVAVMIYTSPILFIVTALVLFGSLSVFKIVGGRSRNYYRKQQAALGRVNGEIQEVIEGLKVVKAFGHEEISKEKFDALNCEYRDAATDANFFAGSIMPISANILNIGYALTAILGGFLALVMGFDIGGYAAYLTYSRQIGGPVNQVSQQITAIFSALAGAERIFDVMDTPPEIDEGDVELIPVVENENGELCKSEDCHPKAWAWKCPNGNGGYTLIPLKGDVVLQNVDFSYVEGKKVLKQVNVYAKPGQKIALVGSTGAGKTTITNLINRFYEINSGTITYDGIDIRRIKKESLRRSLGAVLQDTHLFTGTVMENIRYGNLDATDEECISAAKAANAHSFIRRLPDGYNTMVTGDGANLSQGQRQLLAIARAAVKDPPVMVLDEATSSIDTRTEQHIQKGMDMLMEGRTVFVIAHRLSTVRNSDCIVVIEGGQIQEKGPHEQLLEEKGRYYMLYTGQHVLD